MSQAVSLVSQLLDQAAGKARLPETETRSTYLTLNAALLSVLAAALWGAAVGCTEPALALSNAYKVPMVLVLSLVGAVPPALLWLRLSGSSLSTLALVGSAAQGTFAGTMWLLALCPLVGLYFYTSSWAGPVLAMLGSVLALGAGFRVMLKRLVEHASSPADAAIALRCGIALCVLQLLVLWQLVSLVSPLLPDASPFAGGIDGLRRHW
jgi:hypothetical protein